VLHFAVTLSDAGGSVAQASDPFTSAFRHSPSLRDLPDSSDQIQFFHLNQISGRSAVMTTSARA
jgi:hypothetical protein